MATPTTGRRSTRKPTRITPANSEPWVTAVHADGKIWIAPFSPGFDARLVGGSGTVDRKDGATLITQYQTAVRSSPDLLGLISWNEFSENTYVEPSANFGDRYLTMLRQLTSSGAATDAPPTETDMGDSSSSATADGGDFVFNITLLGAFVLGLITVVTLLTRRRRRLDAGRPPPPVRPSVRSGPPNR